MKDIVSAHDVCLPSQEAGCILVMLSTKVHECFAQRSAKRMHILCKELKRCMVTLSISPTLK